MAKLARGEKGFALVEILVALALTGIIAVVFLTAIATSFKAITLADERTTAESLARSQMEYAKSQAYIAAADGSEVIYLKIAAGQIPSDYTIWSENRAGTVVSDIIGVPWDTQTGLAVVVDAGLQRVKLTIKHYGVAVITLEDYKVDR